ncbi:Glutathione S-transferase/chloride channel C-terminal [Penicillium sp. DV-2018c]|nr:Glutathione S-transferase/chloride channel C-terminal [Penicillium sp. DV-2018c]
MTSGITNKITDWVKPDDKSGEFKRQQSVFRNWVSREAGAQFPPEKGRYHLYVSYACPWAHRTLITRKLKGLEDIISFSSVHWHLGGEGWRFPTPDEKLPGENTIPDPLHPDFTHLKQIYFSNDPDYTGRFTVPVLFDKKTKLIVSNELRNHPHALPRIRRPRRRTIQESRPLPPTLQSEIEASNDWIYNDVNNGVYKSGFATTQEAYEKAVTTLFSSLDKIEAHLAKQQSNGKPYFYGDQITEADIRLYTTIIRFDPVYVQHFKCNIRDIRSGYPAIHSWVRRLYWDVPAFRDTTDFEHIKFHYTKSHKQINQFAITPLGPVPDILPKGEEVRAVQVAK